MLRPRWVLALLLALAIAAGFALLGQWQLERALASGAVVERQTEHVVPLSTVLAPGNDVHDTAIGQKVTVTGRYVPGDEQLVQGRVNHGDEGFWVVSHLVTDTASIPVARGWAKERADAEAAMATLEADAAASVTVTGRFLPSEAPVVPADGADPHSMSTLSVAALINLWTPTGSPDVYLGYVVADSAPAGLETISSPPPEEPFTLNWLNIFYAAEWAVFAGFAVFLWYRLVKDALEREEEEVALREGQRSPASAPPPGT
ncbi:SURF1 family protein [Cryobacterium tepidiphilum]|uniref:SURF1-like protein n=2 Tax=Cryobacterium tepidiphilum TaxID=2486026 RepID=A0A3M8LHU7_9MICO|nr:SURF1 family protein [Cryobacterium tepidiphilum]